MNGTSSSERRIIILGAAGRDYHYFNTCQRGDDGDDADADGAAGGALPPRDLVVAFTHAQIPHIAASRYPPSLCVPLGSGGTPKNNRPRYPDGVPIYPEAALERAIAATNAQACVFAYSDVSFEQLGALASRCRRAGCDFVLPSAGAGGKHDPSTLKAKKPVVAVTAVRTGCGKSQVCALVCEAAKKHGLKVALCRHPMPYGDLEKMRVQRFETLEDLDEQDATVEEREEYEQHLRKGVVVFAGVDYKQILRAAEQEADVVLFDGGNNDTPFFAADLDVCVCDPFRPRAHETHFPGGINFARAKHLVVNKANTAPPEGVAQVLAAAEKLNPGAKTYVTASKVALLPLSSEGDDPSSLIRGKRVLCVDDGPTITHGGMAEGAAVVGAKENGAAEIVDPRPFFRGALKTALDNYPHIGRTVPALGYGQEQVRDLAATIKAAVEGTGAEAVLVATPTDLSRVLGEPSSAAASWSAGVPVVRAMYAIEDIEGGGGNGGGLAAMLDEWFAARRREMLSPAAAS